MVTWKLRTALLTSAALTALCLQPATPARAGPDWCTHNVNTRTAICSGDQSQGIVEYNQYHLIVRNLSGDIEPASGVSGVVLLNIPYGTIGLEPGPYGIITTGDDAAGIYAFVTSDRLRIDNDLPITTMGANSDAITALVFVGTGPAEIVNRGDLSTGGDGSRGIALEMGPGGNATVWNGGAITTGGAGSHGVVGSALTGDATVTSEGTITVTGDAAFGLFASAGGPAALAANTGELTVSGANSRGLYAWGTNDAHAVNDGSVTASGVFASGLTARAGSGLASATNNGSLVNTGTYGMGVFAVSDAGAARAINAGSITMTGYASEAIVVRGVESEVQNDGPLNLGRDRSYGIDAQASGSVLVTSTGDVTATGGGSIGVFAGSTGQGVASIVNSGDVSTSGGASRGLWATASNGDVHIDNSGTIGNSGPGESLGIGAFARAGAVMVVNSAAVSTAGGHAIMATNFVGDIDITNEASLAAGRDGVYAAVFEDGNADIVNAGDISGETAGIRVRATNGDVSIVSAGSVVTSGGSGDASGLMAVSVVGSVTVGNYGTISSASGDGISARTNDGDVSVINDAILAAAGDGIDARANIIGAVTVVNSGDMIVGQRGIAVTTLNGALSIDNHGRIDSRGGSAIEATAAGPSSLAIHNTGNLVALRDGIDGLVGWNDATIVNAGDISSNSDYGRAIHLAAYGQGVATIESAGRLSTAGAYSRGIAVDAHDAVALNVENRGDVHVLGTGAYGMRLMAAGGGIDLVSRGAITAQGGYNYGIAIESTGNDAAMVSEGDIWILGHDGRGIVAKGVNAAVDSSGSLRLDGERAVGIVASASGGGIGADPGTARIVAAGDVTMAGANAVALRARSPLGDAAVLVGGTVTGGSGQDGAGVELFAAGVARLENRGIIQSLNDRAIVNGPRSGSAAIDNRAMIIGFVSLDDGEDDFANRGWFEARGDSDFGSGSDAMVNSGTLHVGDSGAADRVTILGLESFTNAPSGLITMVDGRTGDRLALPALSVFNGGGAIALDAALAGTGSAADLLTVSGVVSGTTLIAVNNVARSSGVRGADDIFVIDQGSRPQGDEFRLAGGPISVGFLYYDLRPDDDGSTRWELYESGTNWQGIDALGTVVTGLQNVWHAGVGAWHQRMGDLLSPAASSRLAPAADDPGALPRTRMSGGLWLRGFGENADYHPPSAADFHQNIAATQGGVDGVARGPLAGDTVIAGLLGAYLRSDLDLEHMPDRAAYEGGSIGGYLAYFNGQFHADMLVKADLLTVSYQQRGLAADFDARSIGGSFELGYRFAIGDGYYLSPLGQLAYVASTIDDGWLAETIPMTFADGNSLRSRTGLRAGYRATFADVMIEPYVDAHLLHEFAGENHGAVFGYRGGGNELDSWGTIGGGIQVDGGRFTAFANLQSFVGEIDGFAGQGGLRLSF